MAATLYASFADPALAEKAAGALLDYGVREQDLSLVVQGDELAEEARDERVAHTATLEERADAPSSRTWDTEHDDEDVDEDRTELAARKGLSTTTPRDAGSGAAKGAGIGLGLGVLGAVASLFIPGVGLVVGGGALAAAIGAAVGTTVAGAVAGGVFGYLKDQGVPEPVAQKYQETYESGGAVLAVTVPSGEVDRATVEEILGKYGAANVNTFANQAAA